MLRQRNRAKRASKERNERDTNGAHVIPTRLGEYALGKSVKQGVREMLRKTSRTGHEYAAELCVQGSRVRLGPVLKGGKDASAVPLGTCKAQSLGWVHTHPRLGVSTNEASVGDLTALLYAHANSGLEGGLACVAHPDHNEMRCYTVVQPVGPEHSDELFRIGGVAGGYSGHLAAGLSSRVKETRVSL